MIYFRVAILMDQPSQWQWKSTILNTPGALFDFLKIYNRIAENRIRVFFATSREFMNEMLLRENRGFISNSVSVDQFLKSGKRICAQDIKQLESEIGLQVNKELLAAKSAITRKLGDAGSPSHTTSSVPSAKQFFSDAAGNNRGGNLLELMKEESERSSGGDCDTPYTFTLPASMRQTLAWTILLAKVQRGELEP